LPPIDDLDDRKP